MDRKFSLLELTVALFVLTIAILSLFAAISVNFRLQRSSQESQIALSAANAKLQEYLAYPLIFRDLNTPGFVIPADFPVFALQPQDGDGMAGEVQITTFGVVPGLPPAGIKFFEIIVIVRWKGASGNQRLVLHSQRFRTAADELAQLEAP